VTEGSREQLQLKLKRDPSTAPRAFASRRNPKGARGPLGMTGLLGPSDKNAGAAGLAAELIGLISAGRIRARHVPLL
jgi:hypothetical protein